MQKMGRNEKLLVAVLVSFAACTIPLASRVRAKEIATAPAVNSIKPELGQTYFTARPGETVIVPLTVHVGRKYEGRVSFGQDMGKLVPVVHWVSTGVYTASTNTNQLQINQGGTILSYTHLPGETRAHTIIVNIPATTTHGIYQCSISIFADHKTFLLPFTINIK